MGIFIPDEIVEDIRQRTDIVEVVSQYVSMERRGKNLLALCPFHQEKTPSFNVNPEKQIFHCFGCGIGGNVFKFLMMVEGITFPDAVKSLGTKAGVAIPERYSPADEARKSKKERAWEIYRLTRDFYHLLLSKDIGKKAVQYLEKRSLSKASQETFQIGFAPPGWDALTRFLLSRSVTQEELVKLGLAQSKEGGCYDRFRDRIIFPIWDSQGRVVGFGGRTMGEDLPKYLNSPEGEYFNKGQLLYALHLARRGIREHGFAVLMEGYIDVVSVHQQGVTNAVASLGTAFTKEQGRLLMNYTQNVVIAYDGDTAGIKAAIRAAEILQEQGCQVRIGTIPDGMDPDEFIQSRGPEGWSHVIDKSLPLVHVKLLQAVKQYGLRNSASKQRILQEVLPNLAGVASSIELEEAVKHTATVLQVNWETVSDELKKYKINDRKKSHFRDISAKDSHNIASNSKIIQPKMPADARSSAEANLLRLALEDNQWLKRIVTELGRDFFQDTEYQAIFSAIIDSGAGGVTATLFEKLEESQQKVYSELLVKDIPGYNLEQVFADLIKSIKKSGNKAKLTNLLEQLATAERTGDTEKVLKLRREINLSILKSEGPERGVAT